MSYPEETALKRRLTRLRREQRADPTPERAATINDLARRLDRVQMVNTLRDDDR